MNGKIIIGGVVVLICLIGGILLWQKISEPLTQLPGQPAQELKLSDFPGKFKEKTAIVLGDNASEIERHAAEEIKNFLVENGSTDIKIIDSQKIENFKKGYDLVIIGTPKTNPLLEEVYALTNATRVTEEYPGEGKGVLEILRNPWDESKAMLLVEGWNECSIMLALKSVKESNMSNTLTHTHICNTIAVEVIVQAIEDAELIDWEASTVPEYKGVGVFRVTVKVLNVTEGNVCLKKGELVTLIFRKPIPKLSLPKPILKGQELIVSGLYTVDKKTISSDAVNVEVKPEYGRQYG